jgi:hypothetical protein
MVLEHHLIIYVKDFLIFLIILLFLQFIFMSPENYTMLFVYHGLHISFAIQQLINQVQLHCLLNTTLLIIYHILND